MSVRKINPRRYRHRITIKDSTTSANTMNEEVRTATVFAKRWARVVTQGARELVAARQVSGEMTHRFAMLSDSKTRAVTPKMTVTWGTKDLEVIGAWDVDG